MLKRLWVYVFPMLFLPNMGTAYTTRFGLLEMSDWWIGPYLILVFLAANLKKRTLIDRAGSLIVAFLLWAFLMTISINMRYEYEDYYHVQFGLLKMGKFVLYGLAGYLTSKCIVDERARKRLAAAIVAAGIILGISAFLAGTREEQYAAQATGSLVGYHSGDATSVYTCMMACYLAGLWSQRKLMTRWTRRLTAASLICLVLGSAMTGGRGGWIAGFCGLFYILWRGGLKRQVVALMIASPLVLVSFYFLVPSFRSRVLFTLNPDSHSNTTGGIDNGGRPQEWRDGLLQFPNDPFWGTGFFHRGGNTSIYATGAHNFFLQLFLETGFPGGVLMILIFRKLWKEAGSPEARARGLDLPARSALIAAMAGAMSENYFYGGLGLFILFALYAMCGALPQRKFSRQSAISYAPIHQYAADTHSG